MELISHFGRTAVESLAYRLQQDGPLTVIGAMARSVGPELEEKLMKVWECEKWPCDVVPSQNVLRGLACDFLAIESEFYKGSDYAAEFIALKKRLSANSGPFQGGAPEMKKHFDTPTHSPCAGRVGDDFTVYG